MNVDLHAHPERSAQVESASVGTDLPPFVPGAGSLRTPRDFIAVRDLAANLLGLVAYKGVELGWTPLQIFVFQAPVQRIRDAAQAIIDRGV